MRRPARGTQNGNYKHGGYKSKAYKAWQKLRARCENPKDKKYPIYGGRGINVCKRWQRFENFVADMGQPPTPAHSVDRIDVNGDYAPNNCRWATVLEQNNNRRNTPFFTISGERKSLAEWCRIFNRRYHLIWRRVNRGGLTIKEALEK